MSGCGPLAGAGMLSVLVGDTVIAMESSGDRLRGAKGDALWGWAMWGSAVHEGYKWVSAVWAYGPVPSPPGHQRGGVRVSAWSRRRPHPDPVSCARGLQPLPHVLRRPLWNRRDLELPGEEEAAMHERLAQLRREQHSGGKSQVPSGCGHGFRKCSHAVRQRDTVFSPLPQTGRQREAERKLPV